MAGNPSATFWRQTFRQKSASGSCGMSPHAPVRMLATNRTFTPTTGSDGAGVTSLQNLTDIARQEAGEGRF